MKSCNLMVMSLFFLITACDTTTKTEKDTVKNDINPLLESFDAPFGIPPFDEIEIKHYEPAVEEAMAEHQREIDAIVAQSGKVSFENTIVAYEEAGQLLGRVYGIFSNLNSANTSEDMQDLARKLAPAISEHRDNISLNNALYNRVKLVWEQRDSTELDNEQLKLLEKTYKNFVRKGANLNPDDQKRIREINSRLSLLSLEFGENVLAETNNFELWVSDEADLSGLPDDLIATAAAEASDKGREGEWLFTLHNPSVMPFLQYADNRELRKEIWTAYKNRGNNNNEHDNKEIVAEMVALRIEKANLLGYEHHAEFVLEEQMAKNTDRVYELLDQLWLPALNSAQSEAEDLQSMINSSGESFQLEPYDWRYYSAKYKSQQFNLSDKDVKPYFSIDQVREGIFTVTEKLWGLTYKLREDVPKYHPDVNVYEVFDADGSHLGVLFEDLHVRTPKRGGAWMTSYRKQTVENGQRKAPIIAIVCNFPKPSGDQPALLTFDETTTYFHEFGHALHGLMSDVKFRSLAGTSVPRDFVELPSQALENWATAPEVMRMYAKHYQTGEVIPDSLIERLEQSGTYGQGFATVEYLASTFLDLEFHSRTKPLDVSPVEFENNAMEKLGLISSIIPRHRATYFRHVFSGGYSAGYYSYIWSGVLDADAFEAFVEKDDLFDDETAKLYRDNILSAGGTGDPMEMYVAFRGAEPSIDPLLRRRGLDKAETVKQ